MNRSLIRLLLAVLAAATLVLGACGDGENSADPTPPLDNDDDARATVPRDESGAVGEPRDEDSQTDVGRSDEDVVPTSGTALVVGPFGDADLRLVLTEDAQCAIRQTDDAGDEAAAEVEGTTTDGDRFSLDWSVSVGQLSSTLELDGTAWRANPPVDELDERVIRLTRNDEVFLETTFESESGEERDAQLYVSCRPD